MDTLVTTIIASSAKARMDEFGADRYMHEFGETSEMAGEGHFCQAVFRTKTGLRLMR